MNVALVAEVGSTGPVRTVVSGGCTTVHRCSAGVESKKSDSSTARTRRRCGPTVSSVIRWSITGWPGTIGPCSQPSNRPPSSEHSNSAGSSDLRTNAAAVLVVVAAGPETIVVSGTPWSTFHDHSSGVVSRIPYRLLARTSSVCSPSGRSPSRSGDAHGNQRPRSIAHSNVEPASVDEKTNLAGPLMISASGPMSIVVSGASTTVNAQRAGVGSTLMRFEFVGSTMTERTRNMCLPTKRPSAMNGWSHCSQMPPSTAHSNVARGSLEVKAKATSASPPASGAMPAVGSGGPVVIVVSRPVVSMTVHSHVETGASSTAKMSTRTRTSKTCSPSGRPLYALPGRHGWKLPVSSAHS